MFFSSLLTLFADILIGEPSNRFHPVVWMGKLLSLLERVLYVREGGLAKAAGAILVLIALAGAIATGLLIQYLLLRFLPYFAAMILLAVFASFMIALRSLLVHVRKVLIPLCHFHSVEARKNLSMIVGRDTVNLNRREISRAALETLSESLGDGIISPLFYLMLFGLPGIFMYRMANTMDSMFGHKDERYHDFGWAAARFDDLLNLIPARLCGIIFIPLAFLLVRGRFFPSFKTALADSAKHKSPNAGWLEAAVAGGFGIRLGGLNYYDGEAQEYPVMNASSVRSASPRFLFSGMKIISIAALGGAFFFDLLLFFVLNVKQMF